MEFHLSIQQNKIIMSSLSKHQRARLIFHSLICFTIGLVGGLAWVLVLGGKLQLWPLPPLEFSLPETKELWRNAHIGPIMNGIFVIALAAASPLFTLSTKTAKWLVVLCIVILYGNTIGYQTSPFTTNRGLSTDGGFLNLLCYGSFYLAALSAFGVVGIGIYGSYKTMVSESN